MNPTAQNATKHGLLSECPVIDGFETQEAWLAHRQAFWDDLRPQGAVQEALVERIALTFWRMARLARAEVAAADRFRDQRIALILPLRDPATEALFTLEEARAELRTRDQRLDWLTELDQHPETDPLPAALQTTLRDDLLFALETLADDLALDLPDSGGILTRAYCEASFPPEPTVASLRAVLTRLAVDLGCPPDRLLRTLVAEAREDAYTLSRTLRETEDQVAEIRRTSQLPPEKELMLFTRYDAHLGRELSRLFRTFKDVRVPGPCVVPNEAVLDPTPEASSSPAYPAPASGVSRKEAVESLRGSLSDCGNLRGERIPVSEVSWPRPIRSADPPLGAASLSS